MKKKDETRYFVTSVVSVPVYKVASKTEMFRMSTKPGWGAVEWYSAADNYTNPVTRDRKDKTQQLCCDEDTSASLYLKNGGYFGIFPYEEINVKEMPKQAEVAAIIYSDSCGYSIWAEDYSKVHIFVTRDENGLIDNYRIEYGDSPIYDGEVEVAFEDLYKRADDDWQETYRAEIPGTIQYQFKQEADKLAEESGETWMDDKQREQFRQVCGRIDRIKTALEFYRTMQLLGYDFDEKIVHAARRFKKCFNFSQYEQPQEVARREELMECYEKYALAVEDTVEAGAAAKAASAEATEQAENAVESESGASMRYAIFEGNMERLEKKMARIQNKCRNYGCDFRFETVGEEFRELKDENGEKYTARFVIVEAEGIAVIGGWKFIASVEHTSKGNIINRACDVEVPERYYTGQPVCEHCNSRRARKDTYIVMNEVTGEFKQVGKSCLRDFTHGMSAEVAAQYTAAFESLIVGEQPGEGCRCEHYIDTEEWLRYVAETIRHFGYVRHSDEGEMSTRSRAIDYYGFEHGERFGPKRKAQIRKELDESGFNADSEEAKAEVAAALAWLAEQPEGNNYMHNLKTACALSYIPSKLLGLTASIFPTHNRELEREAERRRQEKAAQASEWVGDVGSRVEVKVAEITTITGWETQWGYTKVYKIVDEAGNIFTWKTSAWVEDNVKTIKGTVKSHNEYRGTRQTELTRCKCAA